MFFDCTGLLCGLAASLITKWKPNDKFSYGFGVWKFFKKENFMNFFEFFSSVTLEQKFWPAL